MKALFRLVNIIITILICYLFIILPEPEKYQFLVVVLALSGLYAGIKNYKQREFKIDFTQREREEIKKIAQKQNKSVSQFLAEAINEKLDKSI